MNREELEKETIEEKYINRMKEYEFKKIVENFYDNKDLHMNFDNCILNFLEELGYKDIVKYYRNSRKRYEFWYD